MKAERTDGLGGLGGGRVSVWKQQQLEVFENKQSNEALMES